MPAKNNYYASISLHSIKWILSFIRQYIQWFKMEQWLLCGSELHSNKKITVLYTGVFLNMNYFAGIIFGADYEESYLGRYHRWNFLKNFNNKNMDYSMVVTEGLKIFSGYMKMNHYTYIPGWILGKIELPDKISNMFNNSSIKSDINHIKSNKLEYILTKDTEHFNLFYYNMYLPFIKARHGNSAILRTYYDLYRKYKNGSLLMVKKADEFVAGMLITFDKKYGHLQNLGVIEGDLTHIKEGVISALYYYSIQYIYSLGYRKIDVGATRSFLNDGIMCYKKKWGFKVEKDSAAGFFIKINKLSWGIYGFLQHNPYITTSKKGNNIVIFNNTDETLEETINRNIENKHLSAGLDGIIINKISPQGSIYQNLRIPLKNKILIND
ncbi:MAG: hypothetical protein ACOWWR_09985 [Eubacteriales bacterium]